MSNEIKLKNKLDHLNNTLDNLKEEYNKKIDELTPKLKFSSAKLSEYKES